MKTRLKKKSLILATKYSVTVVLAKHVVTIIALIRLRVSRNKIRCN